MVFGVYNSMNTYVSKRRIKFIVNKNVNKFEMRETKEIIDSCEGRVNE